MKLSATLPKGRSNGLGELEAVLCEAPSAQALVLLVVDCKKMTTDTDTGEIEATARIVSAEWVDPRQVDAHRAALESLQGLQEKRLGPTLLGGPSA